MSDLSDLFGESVMGRCELRCGANKLLLDFVVARTTAVSLIFERLFRVLGSVKVRLHKGKAQVDTFPFLRLSPSA